MFLIDSPGYEPCLFIQLIPITINKRTNLLVTLLALAVSVCRNTLDMSCIAVAFRELSFFFFFLSARFSVVVDFCAKVEVMLNNDACGQKGTSRFLC